MQKNLDMADTFRPCPDLLRNMLILCWDRRNWWTHVRNTRGITSLKGESSLKENRKGEENGEEEFRGRESKKEEGGCEKGLDKQQCNITLYLATVVDYLCHFPFFLNL